nr:b3 domain-containing transcription factor vrn1 [Quercus suber]
MSLSRSAMGRHCFYVYYDGEQYFHDLHGLSYGGESVKKKFIQLKCKTHFKKMHRKIMEALGLDKESHKISIVYRAPQILVNTQVVYNSNPLCGDADVDMMWAVIKWTPQFIASDLYVTIEAIGFHDGGNSQHASAVEEPRLGYLHVQPSFADAMPLPYNTEPCSAVDHLDNTELLGATQTHDVGGSTHAYEHVEAYMDRGIDIDASRDVYEEFIDTDGPVDEAEVLDGTQLKDNEEDCPITVIPGWFTSNTWDNINDPSPALAPEELTSWHKGDQPAKGMLFNNKASVQYVLTLYSVEHNKQYKVIKSDTNRLLFEANQEKAKRHMVRRMSAQHRLYTVETQSSLLRIGGGAHTHRVSLMDRTCTCGKWEANKIPCSHLIAVCAKYNHDATEFMDRFYRVSERYQSYEPIFQPLKDRLEWPEPAERRKVMPNPRLIREKGRPKSTRIRNEMDDEDRELPTSLWIENGPKSKCGLCRQEVLPSAQSLNNSYESERRNSLENSRTMTSQWQRDNVDDPAHLPTHFFKIIMPQTLQEGKLWIPKKFIREYGSHLSDVAYLTIPNGTKWKVKLTKSDGEVCFGNGWCEFASSHALALGHFLVFRYDGNSEFSVLIFDATATEIEYPAAELQYGAEEKPPVPLPQKRAKKGSRLEKSKMPFGAYLTRGESSGSAHGVTGVAETLVRANALKSENPLFTVTIHPSYINGKDRASLPHGIVTYLPREGFTKDYSTKGSTFTVKLEVVDRLWPVKLYIYEGKYTSCVVSAGWAAFARDNALQLGDVCVFEVIMRDEVVFKVHIFRCPH